MAAVLSLGCAWLAAHPETIEFAALEVRRLLHPLKAGHWIFLPGEGTQYALMDDTLLVMEPEELLAFDLEGNLIWRQDTEMTGPVLRTCGGWAAVYEPGGTALLLAGRNECRAMEITTGIDAAVPGPWGQVAVITTGSGYLTETKLFSPDGEMEQTIGLPDRAMALMCYLEDGTLCDCRLAPDGAWSLCLDGVELPLEAELVYDLRPCGSGAALWTCDGLALYDQSGQFLGELPFRGEALDWVCGEAAALLVRQDGAYRLLTLWSGGTGESGVLPGQPLELAAWGEYLCALDREGLTVCDRTGARIQRYGLTAGHMLKAEDGLLLVGDGRMLLQTIP